MVGKGWHHCYLVYFVLCSALLAGRELRSEEIDKAALDKLAPIPLPEDLQLPRIYVAPIDKSLPLYGEIVDGRLYAAIKGEGPKDFDRLLVGRPDAGPISSSLVIGLDVRTWGLEPTHRTHPLRWRISNGFVWYLARGFPGSASSRWFLLKHWPMTGVLTAAETSRGLSRISESESTIAPKDWGQIVNNKREPKQQVQLGGISHLDGGDGTYATVARRVVPLDAAFYFDWRSPREEPVFFDIYPTSAYSCMVFIIVDPRDTGSQVIPKSANRQMLAFEYRFKAESVDGGRPSWRGRWELKQNIVCDFKESFYAIPGESTYFFVTQSGNLYGTQRDEASGAMKTVLRRADPQEPIRALIRTCDADVTYAFTDANYFQIKENIEPRKFTAGPLGKIDVDSPMPPLRNCAAAIMSARSGKKE